jgi:hypothetical protein
MTGRLSSKRKPWRPITATVTSVESKYGLSRTLETDDNPERSYFVIHFRYSVAGHSYAGDFESRSPLESGHTVELLYNPANPQQNSLSKPIPTGVNRAIFWAIIALLAGLLIYLAVAINWRT